MRVVNENAFISWKKLELKMAMKCFVQVLLVFNQQKKY